MRACCSLVPGALPPPPPAPRSWPSPPPTPCAPPTAAPAGRSRSRPTGGGLGGACLQRQLPVFRWAVLLGCGCTPACAWLHRLLSALRALMPLTAPALTVSFPAPAAPSPQVQGGGQPDRGGPAGGRAPGGWPRSTLCCGPRRCLPSARPLPAAPPLLPLHHQPPAPLFTLQHRPTTTTWTSAPCAATTPPSSRPPSATPRPRSARCPPRSAAPPCWRCPPSATGPPATVSAAGGGRGWGRGWLRRGWGALLVWPSRPPGACTVAVGASCALGRTGCVV